MRMPAPWITCCLVLDLVFVQVYGVLHVQIAVLLPEDNHRSFSIQRVSPAIALALEKVANRSDLVRDTRITVSYADSKCHISEAINQAFNFYMRKEVTLFFGPCCDYAAAPLARQISFWNMPMLTPGAMASDFGDFKKTFYPLLTRVGPTLNSMTAFVIRVLEYFNWSKVKLIYDTYGQSTVVPKLCHLAAEALHQRLLRKVAMGHKVEHDFYKFVQWKEFADKLPSEIGNKYSGKSSFSSYSAASL